MEKKDSTPPIINYGTNLQNKLWNEIWQTVDGSEDGSACTNKLYELLVDAACRYAKWYRLKLNYYEESNKELFEYFLKQNTGAKQN